MQLKTEYREESAGVLTGNKNHYIVCTVTFSAEEKAILQQRGVYDLNIDVPAGIPLPTRIGGLKANLMMWIGGFITPFALMGVIAAHDIGSFFMLIIGIGLFTFGMVNNKEAAKRMQSDDQKLTVRKLLNNPTFTIHAYTASQAREFEQQAREALSALAQVIRDQAVVPERNTYDL